MSVDIEKTLEAKLARMERKLRSFEAAISRLPSDDWRAVESGGEIVWVRVRGDVDGAV